MWAFFAKEADQLFQQLDIPAHVRQGLGPIEDRLRIGRLILRVCGHGAVSRNRRVVDGGQTLDDLEQFLRLERLGHIAVHARRQTLLAVPLHGVSGHGHDRQMAAGGFLALTDHRRRLEATHLGHLHVHQHHIKGRGGREICRGVALPKEGGQRLAAVVHDRDGVSPLLQQPQRQLLVDNIVLGQQQMQAALALFHGRT